MMDAQTLATVLARRNEGTLEQVRNDWILLLAAPDGTATAVTIKELAGLLDRERAGKLQPAPRRSTD